MLTCIPKSLFSWSFEVHGLSNGPASLAFEFFKEQGSISLRGAKFHVRKHGFLSGHWSLELDGKSYADALKPNAMFRLFEVSAGAVQLTVKAQSAFTRRYDIISGGQVIGRIQPAHVFTRRGFIDCDSVVPEVVQLFSFWLAVITWRRSARSKST
jgi:hypothetical protein